MPPKPHKKGFDKRNLWPWCDWMTIGIGVLATSPEGRKENRRPDTAILIADTMGSYGSVDSHPRLHKAFIFEKAGMYAVAADQIDRAGELLAAIEQAILVIPKAERTHGELTRTVAAVCYGYKRGKFTTHEFPKLRLPPQEIDPTTVTPALNAIVQERWENFSIGCDLVLAIFTAGKTPTLMQVNGAEHELGNMMFPGFAAIGVGAEHAVFWLSRRQQMFGYVPLRAAYHAYEAKIMAESSPHVNEHLDIIVATDNEQWYSSTHRIDHRFPEHPEINIKNLQRMWKKYSTRDTSNVGLGEIEIKRASRRSV